MAYERGNYQQGSSNGIAATFAGSNVAAGVDLALREYTPDFSGQQGAVRLSLLVGSSRFQLCPNIRLGGARDKWTVDADNEVTGTTLAAAGGINIGLEQPVYDELTVLPFAGVFYRFAATAFSIGAPSAETAVGGDTVSTVVIEYGLVARYRFLYAGVAAGRTPAEKGVRPQSGRIIVGFSMSGLNNGMSRARRVEQPRR